MSTETELKELEDTIKDIEKGLPTLPTGKVKATTKSPENLIIFTKPKTGKTALAAELENSLLIDLEGGSNFVDAVKMSATSVQEISAIGKAIKAAGYPYKYVVVDTVTALENIILPYAEQIYSKSPMGKNWFTEGKAKYGSILNLANGAGYSWTRDAFFKVVDLFKKMAPRVIFLGHIKETLQDKQGVEFSSAELDLTGKVKRLLASQSDAIGYMYRKGDQNIISFKTSDEISCGARPAHLKNQEFVISEYDADGNFITHWDKIFID